MSNTCNHENRIFSYSNLSWVVTKILKEGSPITPLPISTYFALDKPIGAIFCELLLSKSRKDAESPSHEPL